MAHSQDLASLDVTGLEDYLHVKEGKGGLFKAKALVRLLNFFFKFYFIFKLYNIVLVLPNINF